MIACSMVRDARRCRAPHHEEPGLVLGSIAAVHRERE